MGRNVKPGITFYRMDTDHIRNKKVRLLIAEFDSNGYYIWQALVSHGYEKWGYYFDMNDKEEMELFCLDIKKPLPLVQEVIQGCIRRDLFDKDVADVSGILTSVMMQEVYLYATAERRRKGSTFEMQENWLLLEKNDDFPGNIKIVPGNKKNLPVKKPQTKQNEDKTKRNSLAPATPAPPPDPDKKSGKKQEVETEPYWQNLVDCFFQFYRKNFNGEDPSFAGRDPKIFKEIIHLLKKRADKKKIEWSNENAVRMLTYFLEEAYSDEWLQKHFLLKNLHTQFDSVYQRALDKKQNKDQPVKAPATGKTLQVAGALSQADLAYMIDRFKEGSLDDRILDPTLYKKMVLCGLFSENFMYKFEGSPDEQVKLAIKAWLQKQMEEAA